MIVAVQLFLAADLDRGIALYRQQKFTDAEAEFRKLTKQGNDRAAARLYLVRTLLEQNRVPDALAELEIALADRSNPETMFQAGKIARELAERRLADLKATAPGSAAVLELSGRQLETRGKNEEALAEYRQAVRLSPNRPGIHYRIGNVLYKLRRPEDAQAELKKELAASPHHAMANLRFGEVLILQKDEASAVAPLEFAVKTMPDLMEARKELGKAYRETSREADARREWEIVAKQRPGDEEIHYLLGNLYRSLGEVELSKRELAIHRKLLEQKRQLSEKK